MTKRVRQFQRDNSQLSCIKCWGSIVKTPSSLFLCPQRKLAETPAATSRVWSGRPKAKKSPPDHCRSIPARSYTTTSPRMRQRGRAMASLSLRSDNEGVTLYLYKIPTPTPCARKQNTESLRQKIGADSKTAAATATTASPVSTAALRPDHASRALWGVWRTGEVVGNLTADTDRTAGDGSHGETEHESSSGGSAGSGGSSGGRRCDVSESEDFIRNNGSMGGDGRGDGGHPAAGAGAGSGLLCRDGRLAACDGSLGSGTLGGKNVPPLCPSFPSPILPLLLSACRLYRSVPEPGL